MMNFVAEILRHIVEMKSTDFSAVFEDARSELVQSLLNNPRHGIDNMLSNFDKIFIKNNLQWFELFEKLRSLSCDTFQKHLNTWLISGRFLIYVYGNFTAH